MHCEQILYSPTTPVFPSSPNVNVLFILWFLISFLGSVVFIFFSYIRNNQIYTLEQIRENQVITGVAISSKLSVLEKRTKDFLALVKMFRMNFLTC